MNTLKLIAALAIAACSTATFAQHSGHGHSAAAPSAPASGYAGEHTRDIKALSANDVAGLLSGAGMGYAKAAELNGYPGPAHVLELATPLQLSADQLAATQRLMAQHKDNAKALGTQLLAAEQALDAAFATRQVDSPRLHELTQRIGTLQASLRAEHLQTHLAQTALMQPQQIASYARLRGYTADTPTR